jgi:steroid delta-isomerase-like uncharacterized protein
MTEKENIAVIEREIEAFNRKDWDAYLECFDKSVVTLEPDEDTPILGHEGLKRRVVRYTRAFPDVRLETERMFGQGDLVCLNSLFIGTHKGDLPGPGATQIPATGKKVRVHGCSVFRIRKGKITEFIGYYDQVELFNQIGKKVRLQ